MRKCAKHFFSQVIFIFMVLSLCFPYGLATPAEAAFLTGGNLPNQFANNGTSIYYTSGNLGVGTSAPTSPLHVVGNIYSTAGIIASTLWSSDSIRKLNASSPLYFRNAGGTAEMTIDGSGNVGVGTTNPTTKTEIQRIETVDRTTYNDILTISANATTMPYDGHGGGILFRGTNYVNGGGSTNYARIGSTINDNSVNHFGAGLFFDVTPTHDGTLTRAMTINYNGNVGIGKAPAVNLDVNGAISAGSTVNGTGLCISGDCKASWAAVGSASSGWTQNGNEVYKTNTAGNVGIGTTAPGWKLTTNTTANTGAWGSNFYSDYYGVHIGVNSTNSSYYAFDVQSGMTSASDGGEHNVLLRVKNDGNVGIGVAAPGAKLAVSGGDIVAETGQGRFKGWYNAGSGLAAELGISSGEAYFIAYNRTTSAYSPINMQAGTTALRLPVGGMATLTNGLSVSSGNVGIGTATPIGKFQIGSNTFAGGNGVYDNSRIGAMVNGNLTSMVYASTYNDPSYPDYGLVFIHGPNTSSYNVWSISPDGPAKGNSLNFIYQANATNIHSQTPKVVFKGDGNVGIAKASPTVALDVTGSGNFTGTVNGTGLCIGGDCKASWAAVGSASSGWTQNGAEVYKTNTAGNIGIGTTAPTRNLSVVNASGGASIGLSTNLRGATEEIFMVGNTGSGVNDGFLGLYDNGVRKVLIGANNARSGDTYFNGGGNVGIGTAAPVDKLHVSAPTGGGVYVEAVDNPRITLRDTGNSSTILRSTGDAFHLDTWNVASALYVNGTTGNLGVGTVSPGAKLDVNGTIRQGSILARPLATWSSTAATGAVIIKLPGNTGNYGMLHIVINTYEYSGNVGTTYICSGHNWNAAWYSYSCNTIGVSDKSIRLAVKDGQYAIVLGGVGTSWSYGHVVLSEVTTGGYYSGVMDLGGTYTIALDNSAEAYTWISGNLNSHKEGNIYANGLINAGSSVNGTSLCIAGDCKTAWSQVGSTNADTVDSQHFAWSNNDNNPSYLWGANTNGSSFLVARASMNVNYASSAGSATNATSATNADTVDSLHVHSGTNNVANQIVRTDANGYIQAGWINTISGDNGTAAIDRVYASSDAYLRYYTPTNFRTVLDVPTRGGSGASGTWGINITGNSGYAATAGSATTATSANSAGSATYATYHSSQDTRNTNDLPQDFGPLVKFDFKANSVNGLSDGGTYNGVMTWRKYGSAADFSGGPAFQLAYTDNGNLYSRLSTSGTTWQAWSKIRAGYADSAGSVSNADMVDSQHFAWSNNDNNPSYLWGANSNGSSFLVARGSMSVNYAGSAGSATTATSATSATTATNAGNVTGTIGGVALSQFVQGIPYGSQGTNPTYDTRTMGRDVYSPDETFALGKAGFLDIWKAGGMPPGTSHIQGFQAMHYLYGYGIQIAGQYDQDSVYVRQATGATLRAWRKIIDSGNIASQSVSYAGSAGSATTATSATSASSASQASYLNTTGLYYQGGNVGVGTASPGSNLHVLGTNPDIYITKSAASSYSGLRFFIGATANWFVGSRETSAGGTGDDFSIYSFGTSAEAMRVRRATGNIGIGTTAPYNRLEVMQSGSATYAGSSQFRVSSGVNGQRAEMVFSDNLTSNALISFLPTGVATTQRLSLSASYPNVESDFVLLGNGNVGIGITNPSTKFYVNGDVTANAYYYSSDRTLKTNIKTLDNSLAKILQLRGVSFDWKKDGKTSMGLIAQEVKQVYPELVNGQDGNLSIQYGNLVAPLIESIKEQQEKINTLEERIKVLEKKKK